MIVMPRYTNGAVVYAPFYMHIEKMLKIAELFSIPVTELLDGARIKKRTEIDFSIRTI